MINMRIYTVIVSFFDIFKMACCVIVPDDDDNDDDDYDDSDNDYYDYVNAEICRRNGSCTVVCTMCANVCVNKVPRNKVPSVPKKVIYIF
jgi:hypothetical protein